MKRRGLGKGLGMGYKNLVVRDPYIHSLSGKGIKTNPSKGLKVGDIFQGIYITKISDAGNTITGVHIDTGKRTIHYESDKGGWDIVQELNAKLSPEQLERDLRQFTGTEQYHRLSFMPLLATDGVAYLMEKAESYWLFDAIASYQPKLKKEPFQVWIFEREENEATLKAFSDYSEKEPKRFKPIVTQKFEYTDFPLKKIKIYVQNGVALLPSEY